LFFSIVLLTANAIHGNSIRAAAVSPSSQHPFVLVFFVPRRTKKKAGIGLKRGLRERRKPRQKRKGYKMATNSIKLLTGNSHPQLAKLVADRYVLGFSWWGMQLPRPWKGTGHNSCGMTTCAGKENGRMKEANVCDRLGIELAKTMSLNYSNQETSVTVGESVRDEDGIYFRFLSPLLRMTSRVLCTS
jgi:ribose-phosphate pyrophosphokinase